MNKARNQEKLENGTRELIKRVYQVSPQAARTRNQRNVIQEFVNDSLPPLDDHLAQFISQNKDKKQDKVLRGLISNTKFYIFDQELEHKNPHNAVKLG